MKSSRKIRLVLETLERRDLMALWDGPVGYMDQGPDGPPRQGGNVTAEVIDGKLIIRGDANANGVMIYPIHSGGYLIDSVNGWSLINGQNTRQGNNPTNPWNVVEITGPVTSIDIDMGDGDDYVAIHGWSAPGMVIRTGNGDDALHFDGEGPHFSMAMTDVIRGPAGPITIQGNLLIDTGAGNDRLLPWVKVAGDAIVQMGTGDDSLLTGATGGSIIYASVPVRLVATGQRIIDLGADQEEVPLPSDWRIDEDLIAKVGPTVLDAFAKYAAARAAGTVTLGEFWSWHFAGQNQAAVVDASGRLELEFTYFPGFQRVIDRLQNRGLMLESYSTSNGLAYFSLARESDLRYFANLPGIGQIMLRGTMFGGNLPFDWEYVRGTGVPGVEPPVDLPAVIPPPTLPPASPPLMRVVDEVFGPVRFEDLHRPLENDADDTSQAVVPAEDDSNADEELSEETLSLLVSYFGSGSGYGPRKLEDASLRRSEAR